MLAGIKYNTMLPCDNLENDSICINIAAFYKEGVYGMQAWASSSHFLRDNHLATCNVWKHNSSKQT